MTIDGDRKFHTEKPEKITFVLQYFYLPCTREINFFVQIVTTAFSGALGKTIA